jgi:two-component system response regulator PhoP
MRILIVEDDSDIREQVKQELKKAGFVVNTAEDGKMGLHYALDYPILILTARSRWQNKVEGLEAGADDYVEKPFYAEELLARVRALLRRTGRWAASEMVCGVIKLNNSEQRVFLHDKEVSLTAFEYKVIEHLMLHAGKVISKSELTEKMYDDDSDRDSNVIEVFIRRLRIKLDPDNTLKPIETLRGRGYRFTLARTPSA